MSYGDSTNPSQLFATFCKIINIQSTPELCDFRLDLSRMLLFKETGEISQEVWDGILYDVLKSNKRAQEVFLSEHRKLQKYFRNVGYGDIIKVQVQIYLLAASDAVFA